MHLKININFWKAMSSKYSSLYSRSIYFIYYVDRGIWEKYESKIGGGGVRNIYWHTTRKFLNQNKIQRKLFHACTCANFNPNLNFDLKAYSNPNFNPKYCFLCVYIFFCQYLLWYSMCSAAHSRSVY